MTQAPPTDLPATLQAYRRAIDSLYSLVTDPTGDRVFEDKSDRLVQHEHAERLARTTDFLDFAGNPQQQYRTVHIAGTSGKGSVAAITAAILGRAGRRTGLHVSPYLQLPLEKLVVNGQMAAPGNFAASVRRLMRLRDDWVRANRAFNDLRYGEAWVALTYLWLAWQRVEWAVIETGLGGRYDPTNAITPELSLITNVNFDHTKSLGPGLLSIAHHKAGIIKPGRPAVTTETNPEVIELFQREAARQGSRLYVLGRDFDCSVTAQDGRGITVDVQGPFNRYPGLRLNLPGAFQARNVALAVAGLDVLAGGGALSLPAAQVAEAVAAVKFPGRMELVQDSPRVILDGAHNPHKIEALARSIRATYPQQPITAIVGMMRVKDAEGILSNLAPLVSRFIVTAPVVFGKRSFPPDELAAIIRAVAPAAKVQVVESVKDSVKYALATLPVEELLLVTGSIYLVGEARDTWFPREELLAQLELNQTE
ncbi:MAG: folylpolyglutamate synthase/dihydrofolate synthase family protein [Anaerolineae bacterium]